ncbi:MAG: Glucose-6-phosphate 1-dehydrogenase 2 [Verrucomicrobiae bacterium]|nr:Glucose-6-phosphate 1-dehydrogenase 2 [Verrucomicrobiae bacterium]
MILPPAIPASGLHPCAGKFTFAAMENPLREGLVTRHAAEPCVVVIFGATGDLTRRKLVPALCNLAHEGQLPAGFAVVGFARRPKSNAEFRAELLDGVKKFSRFNPINPAVWDSFAQGIFYHQAEFSDATGYDRLNQFLRQLDKDRGTAGNRLFYLATAPPDFTTIIRQLGAHGLGRGTASRIIVEKPFGRSLATAHELNTELATVFDENQVYRIDHYLGKETVQNILALRFANEIFEPLWNQKYIDHVQITVSESLGVETRGSYYEKSGALRDMVQNHMMQLLALVGMEPPAGLAANDIRDEKVKVLRSIRPIEPGHISQSSVRGQYAAGSLAGKAVVGYHEELNVAPDSRTETFVALKLFIDNWRWASVPFYLRHGKRLPKQTAEIAIQFKAPPAVLFAAETTAPVQPNVLVLRIQPDEGIAIRMNAKVPGTALHIEPVKMDFRYGGSFGARSPEAYERLLHDALAGDATLFTRSDEVEASWRLMDAVLTGWQTAGRPAAYEAGTWGPPEADAFIAKDGRTWRRP